MKSKILIIIGILLLIGGLSTTLIKHIGPEPEITCVAEGQPSSGFAIVKDGKDCPLSQEDFEEWWEYDQSAVPVKRIGLAAAVLGLGLGITGIVLARKESKGKNNTSQGDVQFPPRQSQ